MKYIFFDDDYGISEILMRNLEHHPDCYVVYRDRIHNSYILNFICRILFSTRVNNRFYIPLKRFWYWLLFKIHHKKDTKVVTMTVSWYHNDWIQYIKTTYPEAKLVLVIRDTVLSKEKSNKRFKIEEAKQKFDLILSYDNIHDVPKYGLTYAPVFMSKIEEFSSPLQCKYDISFIADAKDRMGIVNILYKKIMANGLSSFLYIFHTKNSDKLPGSNIIYANQYIGRIEMLRKELESNCMLEVLKGDAHSNTLRFWEAVMYNKKLYTNWAGAIDSPYYDPRYMRVFSNPEDIDLDFIKERIEVDYNYQGELSPLKFLEIFEKLLQKKDDI